MGRDMYTTYLFASVLLPLTGDALVALRVACTSHDKREIGC